ncbi:OsmC family protein [Mariniblastus fucicola]|uniref:OsmC-like protein n=1 Tax=Mariniblastus fucicola TaxID=980251 RepID=A0A5B9PFF0_9BACT|nr:OsmC family protein [Mariniblastus fucicola]QEG21623.1 OsmC-like protein [Mariniblastus fucicola]
MSEANQKSADEGHGVSVVERDGSFTQDISARKHSIVADEPASVDGADLGMTPYELLLSALGACTSMTLRMYAKRKGISLDRVSVELVHDRIDSEDCETCDDQPNKVDRIRRVVTIEGDVTEAQRARMLEIAAMCPVHRTLTNQIQILTEPA